MISTQQPGYMLTYAHLSTCLTVIDRSGAVEYVETIAAEHRGQGGRRPSGHAPGLRAVLTVWLALLRMGRTPSLAETHRVLSALNGSQRSLLGIPVGGDLLGYKAFHGWLTRLFAPFDSGADHPIRRECNEDFRNRVTNRTREQRAASKAAVARREYLSNLLVAGSIDDASPDGGVGDVVADETIVDLAGPAQGLGAKPEKKRGAAYIGGYYSSDKKTGTAHSGESTRIVTDRGFGVGITAVSRVGNPDNLYSIAPVVTGISIHEPSSGSLDALESALQAHRRNGFDLSRGRARNSRLPNCTVDMGYSVKKGFTTLMFDMGFAPVVRYPLHWQLTWASESDVHKVGGVASGPVQYKGVFTVLQCWTSCRQSRRFAVRPTF